MTDFLHNLMGIAPAFWYFLSLAAGTFAGTGDLSPPRVAPLPGMLFVFGLLAKAGWKRQVLAAVLFLGGFAWGRLFLLAPDQTYLHCLPRQECFAQLQMILCEGNPLPPDLQYLSSGREKFHGEIVAIRHYLSPNWQEVSGKVLLQCGIDLKEDLQSLTVGQKFIAEGTLLLPPEANSPGGYYGRYLRIQGIHRIFRIQNFLEKGEIDASFSTKIQRGLLRFRQGVARKLAAGISHGDAARMLLALGVGMNELLPSEENQRFVRSGTVHIFSISGLHVGMVILIVEGLFRIIGLPLRLRWFLLGPALLAYLLLTGISPSVLRAFSMSLLLLYSCWRFRPPAALNSLGFSGIATLMGNPLYILHTGFLYSYLIVAVLILGLGYVRKLRVILAERRRWIPRRVQGMRRLEGTMANLAASGVTSTLAWLSSAGITLRMNCCFCLVSPLVNLPLGITVFVILLLCPVKYLLASGCPTGVTLFNSALVPLLNSLPFWAETAAGSFLSRQIVPLSTGEFLLYYSVLALWLLYLFLKNPH